jgi:GntR family transcriptional regulator
VSYDTMTLGMRLDPSSATPIYAQIVDQVKTLLATRALRPGDKLPSVRDLAVALRVNRNTAAKAYQALESEGVLETRSGHGTFVAASGPRWSEGERLRRIERSLDRCLVEASHLEIPFGDLPPLLRKRIEVFDRDRLKKKE